MNKHQKTVRQGVDTLAEDARALLNVTSGVAGEKVAEARDRLNAALARGKEIYGDAKDRAVAGARAGDNFVRTNPYAAAGIAFGIGAIIGLLMRRRHY